MNFRFFPYDLIFCGTRAAVWAALICLVSTAASCRSQRVIEVQVPIHDTTYVHHNVHDSVFVEHTIREFVKGDTVFIEKTKTKYIEKIKADTVYKQKEVPVEVKTVEIEYVEKKEGWFQKTLKFLGCCFIGSLLAAVAIFIIGLKKK